VDEVVKHNTGESEARQPVMSDEELAHTIIAPCLIHVVLAVLGQTNEAGEDFDRCIAINEKEGKKVRAYVADRGATIRPEERLRSQASKERRRTFAFSPDFSW